MSNQHAELAAACASVGLDVRDGRCFQDRTGTIRTSSEPLPIPELLEKLEGWLRKRDGYRASALHHDRRGWIQKFQFLYFRVSSANWYIDKQAARVKCAIATVKKLEGQG